MKQLVAPKKISEMKWVDIKSSILSYLEPKKRLLIAERTTFMAMKQSEAESVAGFAARLREQVMVCKFDEFKEDNSNPAEQLIKMRLIAGLCSQENRNKILEREVTQELSVDQITDYVQQLLLVNEFSISQQSGSTFVHKIDQTKMLHTTYSEKDKLKCGRCGLMQHQDYLEFRAKKVVCYKSGKNGHFARVSRKSTDKSHFASKASVEDTQEVKDESVFFCVDGKPAEFRYVKINGTRVKMEMDSGASCSLISRKIWNDLGRPILKNQSQRCTHMMVIS